MIKQTLIRWENLYRPVNVYLRASAILSNAGGASKLVAVRLYLAIQELKT